MRRIETYDWWPELVSRKDELSLRELAERFDVTPGAISAAFKRTGLSRKAAPPGPRIRRKSSSKGMNGEESLPPEPGEGGEAGATVRPGSKDSRILPYANLLGQVPDSEVAKKAGVSVRTIASFRSRNSVGGYKGPRKRGADRAPRKSRIDAFAHLVGQFPDRVVAEKAGVSLNAVRNWRMRHGVPASGRAAADTGFSVDLVSTQTGPSDGSASGAWKVVTAQGREGLVRVVVAGSLADAASRVEKAGLGKIIALEWIGDVV
ncbi:MAG: hypothetical protein ABMB14_25900 [Myxococcota bacterium]